MIIILAIVIVVGALLLVAYPVIARHRPEPATASSAEEELDELLARRAAAFQALRDLAFDHQVGKITDEDRVVFEAHLKQTAAEALRQLDLWETAADRALAPLLARARAGEARQRDADGRRCPACGRPAAAEDKFCGGCGSALPAVAPRTAGGVLICPTCRHPFEAGDRFCAGCGARLPEVVTPT